MSADVYTAVKKTVCGHNMIICGEEVAAGLSGGADSVCLLICLNRLSEEIGFKLRAVHVNHCLRGAESDGDELFCQKLCQRLNIPFDSERVDVRKYAAMRGMSDEEAARELRYGVFERISRKYGCKIATAHNLCDAGETVIFNAARGTGIKGLCGIPYVRGSIIRPLLDVSRADIEAFLLSIGQDYVTDSTNLSDDYSRNLIRHRVIPVLEQINGRFHESMLRLRQSASEDEEFFSDYLKKLSPNEIYRQLPAVRKRYIRDILTEKGISVSADRLNILDEMMISSFDRQRRYELSGSDFAVFRKGVMTVESISQAEDISVSYNVNPRENCVINVCEFDKTVIISGIKYEKSYQNSIINKKLTNSLGNYDKIQGAVILRNKQSGDIIQLKGRDFHTKLKKYYNSLGLSAEERRSALVMEDSAGLVWSEYGGFSERIAACEGDRTDSLFSAEVVISSETGKGNSVMNDAALKEGADRYGYKHIKRVLLSEEEIREGVKRAGRDITERYSGKPLLLVSILKGAFVFMADLCREVKIPCEIGFMACESYGASSVSSGDVNITLDLKQDISKYHVVIVEDIVDSGRTLSLIAEKLRQRDPLSLKVYTLLDKPERRVVDFHADYSVFTVPDLFVVGYGLDYSEQFRNLPYIAEAEI